MHGGGGGHARALGGLRLHHSFSQSIRAPAHLAAVGVVADGQALPQVAGVEGDVPAGGGRGAQGHRATQRGVAWHLRHSRDWCAVRHTVYSSCEAPWRIAACMPLRRPPGADAVQVRERVLALEAHGQLLLHIPRRTDVGAQVEVGN